MIVKEKVPIYTQLANKYSIPHQVVEVICNHPFKFANKVISDDENVKSIMFTYLFKLKLKKKYAKTTESKVLQAGTSGEQIPQ